MYILILYVVPISPGIIIAHPGEDVELLCTLIMINGNVQTGWLINQMGPYGKNVLHNGILTGYRTPLNSDNLIVEDIVMNDIRNDTEYRCVITQGRIILDQSDPIFLYVTGKH